MNESFIQSGPAGIDESGIRAENKQKIIALAEEVRELSVVRKKAENASRAGSWIQRFLSPADAPHYQAESEAHATSNTISAKEAKIGKALLDLIGLDAFAAFEKKLKDLSFQAGIPSAYAYLADHLDLLDDVLKEK